MSTFRLLATNTVAQTVSKITTVLSTLIIGRMIADPDRGLDLPGFSDYSIIVAFAAYFYIICDFGFNAIAAKDITEDETKTKDYLSNLLGLRIALAVAMMMLGLSILAFINYSPLIKVGIIISLITIVSQAIITNNNILFQAKLRYWQSTLAIVAGSAVSLALSLINFLSSGGLLFYILATVAGSAVMATISFMLVNHQVAIRPKFDSRLWKYFTIAALPLGLAIILNLIYIKVGHFILSVYWPQEYGLLSLANRIFEVALVIPVFMVNALYPIMIKRRQVDVAHFKQLVVKGLWLMLGSSTVVAIGIWLTAPLIISIATGNTSFEPSIAILRWLALIIPIFFITNLLLWTTIALNRRKAVVLFYAIGAAISLGLNLWLIPIHGYWSIIFTTALTEAIIGLLLASQLLAMWKHIPASDIPQASSTTSANGIAEEEVAV